MDTQFGLLVEEHLPLVRRLAARMAAQVAPYLEKGDLIGIAAEAILRAAARYDPDRQVPFATFVYLRIRGAMRESVGAVAPLSRGISRRRAARSGRRGSACSLPLELEPASAGTCADELASAIDAARLGPRLGAALASLDRRGRELIERHYFRGESLQEIGRLLGRSRSWASRAHARALVQLRAALDGAPGPARGASPSCADGWMDG
ncbi:MAG TPA: sigma-70 family RNA polymerase sigma factor [Kofleriaceae bacterium]|nr:sigma-70 family RNA polymerase sigma factor [Kofleriaceae bacterium]